MMMMMMTGGGGGGGGIVCLTSLLKLQLPINIHEPPVFCFKGPRIVLMMMGSKE
jgi:hypothetical protein